MAFVQEDGRMYDLTQNDNPSHDVQGCQLQNDTEGRWNCSGIGRQQQQPSRNSSQPMATSDGTYPTYCQDPQSPQPNIFIVEVEGFQIFKDFYVKELAFYNPSTCNTWLGLFKAPFDKGILKKKGLKCIDYCIENFHGLRWEQGDFPYSAIYPIISHFAHNAILYTKGLDKCRWIQQFTTAPVINLEQLGCPPAQELPHASLCQHHNTYHKTCALDKSVRLGKYLSQLYEMGQPTSPDATMYNAIAAMMQTPASSPIKTEPEVP